MYFWCRWCALAERPCYDRNYSGRDSFDVHFRIMVAAGLHFRCHKAIDNPFTECGMGIYEERSDMDMGLRSCRTLLSGEG